MMTNLELLNVTEENIEWLNNNYEKIQEEFAGKIIAIKDKKIVASATTSELILKELENKGIDESDVLIEVIPPKNEITIL